jgi:spermidine synthase
VLYSRPSLHGRDNRPAQRVGAWDGRLIVPLYSTANAADPDPSDPPVRSDARRSDWLLPTLVLLFFCSGACALTYQVLWLRLLGLVFGVTTYAASTVWASFMAGLALGSFSAGYLADRVRRPMRWFGACELLIGATALLTPLALDRLQRIYIGLYPTLSQSIGVLNFTRFVISFAVLIVPAALMGATLPLIVKSSLLRGERLGSRLGLLYGTNTAGAVAGTLATGLYLIPARGIHGTFLAAAAVNLAVGIFAVFAQIFVDPPTRSEQVTSQAPGRGPGPRLRLLSDAQLRLILVVFGLSGVSALALEVVWFRVLTLFLRPTVYGFALMLAAILSGIAIGSYIVTPLLDRRIRWVPVLACLELAIAAATLSSFGLLVHLNSWTTEMRPLLTRFMQEWLVYPTVGSFQAIFPTALLMGAAFPIGLRLWTEGGADDARSVARRIGSFYSVNVAGSIVGSLAAGFWLLPRFGSRTSIVVLAAISFVSGLLLLGMSEWRRSTRTAIAVAACALFAFGVWRSPDPFDKFVAQRYPRQKVLWREEGVDATVSVHSRNDELILTLNGNHQAGTDPATTNQHRVIGHLPMILHPEARTALVIGLGGGATAGAVSLHDGVDVDVVELAGSVVRGALFFDRVNYSVLARPNVRLRVDDGRNYLMLTDRRYDVVTADIIHPIYAGSGNLYSAEYFRLLRGVLKPGGLVLQWVAGTDAEYKIIARTFLTVFPDATAWGDGTLLVGSLEPLRLRRADFDWKLQVPGRALGAAALGSPDFEHFLRFYRAGPEELRAFVGPGEILTDDRPLVEYFLSLPRDRDVDLTPLQGDVRRHLVDE